MSSSEKPRPPQPVSSPNFCLHRRSHGAPHWPRTTLLAASGPHFGGVFAVPGIGRLGWSDAHVRQWRVEYLFSGGWRSRLVNLFASFSVFETSTTVVICYRGGSGEGSGTVPDCPMKFDVNSPKVSRTMAEYKGCANEKENDDKK